MVYAEGEEERVLRAAQIVVDEGIAYPVLVGRLNVIAERIESFGLRLKLGENCECVNVLDDPRYQETRNEYYATVTRKGVTRALARDEMRNRTTLIGAMLVRRGEADAMLCGTYGTYADHLKYVNDVIGMRPRRQHVRRAADADPAGAPAVYLRYARQPRTVRGTDRGDDAARR